MSKGIIVDIGTGDGKFVYQLAQENPGHFVIGIDPNAAGMEEVSAKIYKKENKGGLPNAMFVLSSVEDLPTELNGLANQVFINLPWGSLLEGIVDVDEIIWNNIKRICQPSAVVDIIAGYEKSIESKKLKSSAVLAGQEVSLDYINNQMRDKLEKLNIKLVTSRQLDVGELKNYPSSWGKKLYFGGKNRDFFFIRLMMD